MPCPPVIRRIVSPPSPSGSAAAHHPAERRHNVDEAAGLGRQFLGRGRTLLRCGGRLLGRVFDLTERRADAVERPVLLAAAGPNVVDERAHVRRPFREAADGVGDRSHLRPSGL